MGWRKGLYYLRYYSAHVGYKGEKRTKRTNQVVKAQSDISSLGQVEQDDAAAPSASVVSERGHS